jgi:hypothetical protein
MSRVWRQGDVVFRELVDKEAAEAVKKGGKAEWKVLSLHSENGHPHTVECFVFEKDQKGETNTIPTLGSLFEAEENTLQLIRSDGAALIRTTGPTKVKHAEHAALTLPEGVFSVRHVGLPRQQPAVD